MHVWSCRMFIVDNWLTLISLILYLLVTGPQTGDKGPNVAGIVTGILFALLVVIVITTLLIVLAVLM